jgi:MFS family permease
MVCFGAFAIFFAGYLAASTLLLFTIVRTLHGGPFGALTVANSTVAIDVLPSSRRTEGIGYYGLSNNLAMAIAPTIGIFIYRLTMSFELLFWIALAVACAGWLVDATIKPTEKQVIKNKSKLSLDRFFLVRGWLLGVNMVAFGFCFGVLSNYLAIYGKEQLGITAGTGTYFMLCAIGLMASRIQGGKALRQGRLTQNASQGIIISLVGYTLFILMPTLSSFLAPCSLPLAPCSLPLVYIGYYGSALLIGLGNGHMWPAFQNMTISVADNSQRGTANSTILISWDVGMGLGILLGGIIAENMGYGAAFWTVALVNALGAALFFLATKAFFLQRRLS